jgi:glycerol-3-phosphate O-acyltransferase 3/4
MTISSLVISLIPGTNLKRWLNRHAMLIVFRLYARSFSAVINVHNKEYIPKKSGICVANHTTPVDIVILATNTCFSLVPVANFFKYRLIFAVECARNKDLLLWDC